MPEDFVLYAHSLSEKDKASFLAENSFLLRGNISDNVFDLLEAGGAVHTPKRAAKQLADDKYKAFCFFDKLGVKQPKTLQAETCGNCGGGEHGKDCGSGGGATSSPSASSMSRQLDFSVFL